MGGENNMAHEVDDNGASDSHNGRRRPPVSNTRDNGGTFGDDTDSDGHGHIQNYSGTMHGSNVGGSGTITGSRTAPVKVSLLSSAGHEQILHAKQKPSGTS